MTRFMRRLNFVFRVLFGTDQSINAGRQMTNWGWRLGLAYHHSRPFVHLWKNLKQPIVAIQHKILSSGISRAVMTSEQVKTLSDGYAAFSVDDIPNGRATSNLLIMMWRTRCHGDSYDEDMPWRQKSSSYPALRNCLKADDLLRYPDIADFILSDLFLAMAGHYLQGVPRLASVELWWTTANITTQGSQLYHTDMEDRRQLKIFINLTEVDPEAGPLTFFPLSVSTIVRKEVGHTRGRLQDENVHQYCSPSQTISFVGGVGSGMAIDTSGCLHYGSRTRDSDRLVLMIQYVPFNVQLESTSRAPLFDDSRYANDAVRRLIVKTSNNY